MIIASIIGTLVVAVVSSVAGAVGSYLFLRANPGKKAAVDAEVAKVAPKL